MNPSNYYLQHVIKEPELITQNIKLPLTTLHYAKSGKGKPLIVVPAAASVIYKWESLIKFLGQKYETYFFELPGHGLSTPFKNIYSREQVAQTVEHFVNDLGFDEFTLMGFSFGGILAIETLDFMPDRIKEIILLSPMLTYNAIPYSNNKKIIIKNIDRVLQKKITQRTILRLLRNKAIASTVSSLLKNIGKVEETGSLSETLRTLPASTLDVISHQIYEIFTFDLLKTYTPVKHKCYFTMSIHDPLIKYEETYDTVKKYFPNMKSEKLYLPYHQPPKPFTFNEMNEEFGPLLEMME